MPLCWRLAGDSDMRLWFPPTPQQTISPSAQRKGKHVTQDPERLRGITVYREINRNFAEGDRIQFTAPNRELGVSNRDLGAVERIEGSRIDAKMVGEKERTVSFDAMQMRHSDHGYAVTSHSAQRAYCRTVLVNMDTNVHPELIKRSTTERKPTDSDQGATDGQQQRVFA